jgi:hypothetical protein
LNGYPAAVLFRGGTNLTEANSYEGLLAIGLSRLLNNGV